MRPSGLMAVAMVGLVALSACGDGEAADPSPGPQCESYQLDPEGCPEDQGALEANQTTTSTAPRVAPPALGEDSEVVVIGHRGAAGHHPDNSLAGFAAARGLGATWVELDTRLSADGDVFLSHDPETESGTVVATASSAELAAEGLPTLGEALEVIDEHALGVDVEIKSLPWEEGFDPSLAMVEATMTVLEAHPPAGPVVVSSFNRDALDRVRELTGDDYDTVLILPEGAGGANQVTPLIELGHDGLALEGSALNAAEVDWVSRTLPVWVWTIDDPDDAQALVAAGVTGIITDVPDVISEALAG